jgi:hypothetical protein
MTVNQIRWGTTRGVADQALQSRSIGTGARAASKAASPAALGQTAQAAARIREIFSGMTNPAEQGGAASTPWQPVYETRTRYVTKDIYERRELKATQDVFEDRAVTEEQVVLAERDLYEDRPVYETREIFATRDVFEDRDLYEARDVLEARDVFETRDVYEVRPVHEKQPVHETHVYGTRDIDNFAKTRAAGIDLGADLALKVGDAAAADVKFVGNKKISVSVGGSSTDFAFDGNAGSFSAGLLRALNSIADLKAEYTTEGKLHLKTSNSQSLMISEITNGRRDRSESPLDALGLTAGTTKASVVAYREVEVGTERAAVGTERVKVGAEDVVVGTESVKIGTVKVKTGQESYLAGTERVQTGVEHVKTGSERYAAGTQLVTLGTERVKVGEIQVVVGAEDVKVGTQRMIAGYDRALVGIRRAPATKTDVPGTQFNTATRASARLVDLLFRQVTTAPLMQAAVDMDVVRSAYQLWSPSRI